MGQRVILVDDLDGTESEVTKLFFAVQGSSYEIDLNAKNMEKFNKAVNPFIAAARPAQRQATPNPKAGSTRKRASSGSGRDDVATVRQWAREAGMTVPDRGRLKPDIYEAYDKAHGS